MLIYVSDSEFTQTRFQRIFSHIPLKWHENYCLLTAIFLIIFFFSSLTETGRETLTITNQKVIFSRRAHFPYKCCGFTLCSTTLEGITVRPFRTVLGFRWAQGYGDKVCRSAECSNESLKAAARCPLLFPSLCIGYIAETIALNFQCECCRLDHGVPVHFLFPDGSESIRVPTIDFMNTINALDLVMAEPEKQSMK